MARARGIDAKLNRLKALRAEPAAAEHIAELRRGLADASNIVAAEAAEIIGERLIGEFAPDLIAAFDRFMIEPEESDKLCRAKIAIVEALNKLEHDAEELFLRGVRHVQLEPRWGGSEDTAGPLRGHCAFGLVRMNHREALVILADLLADPDKTARSMAAQSLGESRAPGAIPLLRFKARVGDAEPDVVGDCLTGLMKAAPRESLPFVEEFLRLGQPAAAKVEYPPSDAAERHRDAVRQGAALALGESRRPEALEILKAYWPSAESNGLREVVLLAIAMTRLSGGIEFLIEIIGGKDAAAASLAVTALAIHRHNDAVRERVAAAATATGEAKLMEKFRKKFEGA